MRYQVVIPAGASRTDGELAQAYGVSHKALLPIHDKPMLAFVLEALAASDCVEGITIVGLPDHTLAEYVPKDLPLRYRPDHLGLMENTLAGMEGLPDDRHVLLGTADIPLLTAEAVRDLVQRGEAANAELCYSLVERQTMEARFPNSGRSFRTVADGAFCGGDLSMVTPGMVRRNLAFAQALTAQRKSMVGLARVAGLGILVRLLTHRLRIADVERRVSCLLGGSARAIITPYAELAMDIDRPAHLEVVLRAMAQRHAG